MLVWMIYVLPQMTDLFQQMNLKLPPLTLFVIALSDFLSKYLAYILGLFIFFVVVYKIAHKKYQQVRYYTDKFMLKIPIISQIISSFNTAFITEYLRLAIISGVPLLSSLKTLKKNINNELFREALEDVTTSVMQGSQLSYAFKKTEMFTPFMLRMMSVGENSGTLETQLEIISKFYYEKVDYYAENIGKVIEPLVLIIVGGFMALVISALMGPMYDLISNIQ
jgi:type II secretory pathway component PulF